MPPNTAHIARQYPGVWRGRSLRRGVPALSTGHAALDRRLPGGGWPLGTLTELLSEAPGAGEFSLLLPALAQLSIQGQWITLLDPPWVPYPPAMHGHGVALERLMLIRTRNPNESLWACEQVLRDIRGGAVLAWHDDPGFTRLRRLQLAAREGLKAAFLFRAPAAAPQASPASLRLSLEPSRDGTRVSILKCQGRRPPGPIVIRRSPLLPGLGADIPPALPERDVCPLPLTGQADEAVHAHAH